MSKTPTINKYCVYVELYELDGCAVYLGSFLVRNEAKKHLEQEEKRYKIQAEEYPICAYKMWIDRVEAKEGDYVIYKDQTYKIDEINGDHIVLESTFDVKTINIDEIKKANSGSYQCER